MQVTASQSDAITQRRTSPRIQTPPPPPPVFEPAQRSIAVRDEAFAFPEHELLMSTTDRTGRITHCNAAFCHVSGYSMDELMGQPHNMVRHPDMPAKAFKDMWATIGHGRTWTGLVKNLRKDGRYYWVRAYVTRHHGRRQAARPYVGARQAYGRRSARCHCAVRQIPPGHAGLADRPASHAAGSADGPGAVPPASAHYPAF